MYEYLFHSYSILIHYPKSMSSGLKYSLSSLSPLGDKLKPYISTTGCFRLFGRADNLFLTVQQQPSTSIQPLLMDKLEKLYSEKMVKDLQSSRHSQGVDSFFMLFYLNDLASPGVSLLLSSYIAWMTKVLIILLTESDIGSSFRTLIIKP